MARDVQDFVSLCDVCQIMNDGGKFVKVTAPLHPIKVEPEVWRMVAMYVIVTTPLEGMLHVYIIIIDTKSELKLLSVAQGCNRVTIRYCNDYIGVNMTVWV